MIQENNDTGGGCGGTCDKSSCACPSDEMTSRRQFLQRASTVTIGAMSLTILPVAMGDGTESQLPMANGKGAPNEGDQLFGFLVDSDKCIGAGKCMTACRTENDVPEGSHRTWVERYVHFKDGTLQVDTVPETGFAGSGLPIIDPELVDRSFFVPKLCNQCEDAPCNQVCPVHASFTSPQGVELVDPDRCIGCGYCVQACPYGARFINPETNNADKCTWCYHRVMRNEKPACVEACPVDARVFGRLDDPNSEISKRIAKIPTDVLKEHLGTHPKTRYAGICGEVK
ncbi:MAG: 4Fe-4S dicluster domain-containing protein [Planctomycetaceae bacterium]|jgi:tetrathionate reductase subunit B|nr:4Fe-4S dicluster domain-containing protein [Planctomycetaceae bacterium]MBT6153158.1 4Fe-4S dicluster domain-containing protein [Planctomycetaceae bacterium]MBT6485860.1 4Fe-4S dicluster domain-containing protein [Planctomycetaceae bacterium]MBT6493423.1 4Fe-4S dicluster domain-containing protein [Planctomycetaceae bacterium]